MSTMKPFQATRVLEAFAKGGLDEVMRVTGVAFITSRNYVSKARGTLGLNNGRKNNVKSRLPALDCELVARLWAEGKTNEDIDQITGRRQSVTRARKALGVERMPSHAVKKLARPIGPLTMAELDRHFVLKIGDEYIFRDSHTREEIWKRDETGAVGPYGRRYRFHCVMGIAEKRIA